MWRVTAAALLTMACVGSSPPAAATPASTFEGHCTMAGPVTFTPAATLLPRPGASSASLTGTCTGTLQRGAARLSVVSAASRYTASASSPSMSCGGGTASGTARLSVQGTPLDFALRETRVGPVALLSLRSGTTMTGVVTVDPAGGAEAATSCAGAGLSTVPVNAEFRSL